MAIELTCPTCAGRLRVGDDAAGKQIRCGRCQTVFRVPHADPPGAPPAPPAPPVFDLDDEPEPPRAPRVERRSRRDEDDRDRDEDEERPRRRGRPRDDEDDYDDRPRRRRPPPATGRGPLFWLAMIFGLLVLGSFACCGGGYALLPGAEWRKHESAAGGFSVELPGPVKKDMPIPGMKPDPNIKTEGTVLWKRGEFYMVAYMELPPVGTRANDEAILEEVNREMKADPQIKRVVRSDAVRVSGFVGREIEYVYEDGGTYTGRVVITGRRMYVLVGGGRFVGPGSANIRRFLDSFVITDGAPPAVKNPRR